MLAAPVVLVALLLSAENLELERTFDAPARGSVNGPWALVDLGFFGSSDLVPIAGAGLGIGGELTLTGGLGFQIGSVRFSPTARFAIGPRVFFSPTPAANRAAIGWTPVALALAAPDLINDASGTKLRFTPVFGVTVPTMPAAFLGSLPLTTLSLAGQLERRFGPVEVAYRAEGSTAQCTTAMSTPLPVSCLSSWALSNRLFAEGWFSDTLSLGLGLGWGVWWPVLPNFIRPPAGCPAGSACDPLAVGFGPTHSLSVQALGTWAFTERFGATLELSFSHLPLRSMFSDFSRSVVGGSFNFWFRTDAVIQRNWLDR